MVCNFIEKPQMLWLAVIELIQYRTSLIAEIYPFVLEGLKDQENCYIDIKPSEILMDDTSL